MIEESNQALEALRTVPGAMAPPDLSDIDLRLLRVFCVVVESGGFSAAQSELNVGQSTISTHMADLEARLGMRLCRRGRSGFGLTQHGAAVYESCQKLFSALEDFRSEVSAVQGQLVGTLNIGVLDNTVTDRSNLLSRAIGNLKSQGVNVQINLIVTSPSEIARAIVDKRLHVGIATAHHRESGLLYEEIYQERALLYCGRDHPVFARAPYDLKIEDLSGIEYVSRGYEEKRLNIQKKINAHPTALAYHLEGVAAMTMSGHYVGILPIHYAKIWVDQDLMRPIRPDILHNEVPFFLITKRSGRQVPALEAFREQIAKVYPNLTEGGRQFDLAGGPRKLVSADPAASSAN